MEVAPGGHFGGQKAMADFGILGRTSFFATSLLYYLPTLPYRMYSADLTLYLMSCGTTRIGLIDSDWKRTRDNQPEAKKKKSIFLFINLQSAHLGCFL